MTRFTHVRAVRARYRRWVTTETVSGMLLLVAAALALVWANSPWRDGFTALSGFAFGPEALHLNLNMSAWAADGLLAVFFFVVGVEQMDHHAHQKVAMGAMSVRGTLAA